MTRLSDDFRSAVVTCIVWPSLHLTSSVNSTLHCGQKSGHVQSCRQMGGDGLAECWLEAGGAEGGRRYPVRVAKLWGKCIQTEHVSIVLHSYAVIYLITH